MLKSCGCSYGMCCCGPAKGSAEEARDLLLDKMESYLKPYEFTAVYKDIVYDKRKHSTYPASFKYKEQWNAAFVRWVNEPCTLKVIEAGHETHDKFKYEEYYTPKLLSKALSFIVWSGNFSNEDKEGIQLYFKHLFEYQETRSEWE